MSSTLHAETSRHCVFALTPTSGNLLAMIYDVSAKLNVERAAEFHDKLTNGTIARQEPDGNEIVAAMARARVSDDGQVRWTETCFCPTPLQHERETYLDRYFQNIKTRLVDDHQVYDGTPLMDHLLA